MSFVTTQPEVLAAAAGNLQAIGSAMPAHNAAAAALYAARGYHPVRWFHAMTRDLTTELPPVPAPAGVQIAAFTPARSEDARLIRNEAFRDHWGSTQTSAEDWAHYLSGRAFRPEFSFLAYAGGEPAGFVISQEYPSLPGVRELFIATLGTAARPGNRASARPCCSGRSPRPRRPGSPWPRWWWTPTR